MASSRVGSAALVLVCGVCVCVCVSAAALQRDYGVKLCGREFIRAVIFTCGGSRWRRSVDEEQEEMEENSPFLLSDRGAELVGTPGRGRLALRELLQVVGEQADGGREEALRETGVSTWLDVPFPPGRFRKTDWPNPDRKKRNFSLGLAGLCCTQGCTKHDIGRLC